MKTKTTLLCLFAGLVFTACEKQVEDPEVTADFTFTPATAIAPAALSFTSQCQGATSYSWDFDDGQTASEPNPMHEFAEAGTYQVTLTAKNTSKFAEVTKAVRIGEPLPVATFTVSADNVEVPAEIAFTNTSVNGVSYSWNFGDGSSSAEKSPVHIFTDAGTYTVTLLVGNSSGTSSAQRTLTILEPTVSKDANIFPGVSIGAYKVNETWGSIAGKITEQNYLHTMLYFSPYYYHLCTFKNTGLSFFFQTSTSTLVSTATVIFIGAFSPFDALTDKGILLGSATSEVVDAYGQPTSDKYSNLYYDALGIYFAYDENMLVEEIDVYAGVTQKSTTSVQKVLKELKGKDGVRERVE